MRRAPPWPVCDRRRRFAAAPGGLYCAQRLRENQTMFGFKKIAMPTREQALPGRDQAIRTAQEHFVNHHALKGPYPEGAQKALFGLGCFWGAEKAFWQLGKLGRFGRLRHRGRLCRRRDAEPDLRGSLLGAHRPQRSGAGGLRSEKDFLREPAQDFLGKPRPDAKHAPGQRRRHAVSLRHLRLHARAEKGRA